MKILTDKQLNEIIQRELRNQEERFAHVRDSDEQRQAYWALEKRVTVMEQRMRVRDAPEDMKTYCRQGD